MKNRFLFIGIVVTIALTIVLAMALLLPWPTKIDLQMNGAIVTEDGTVQKEVAFTVSGWKLDYWIRDDSLRLDIDFSSNENPPIKYTQIYGRLYALSPDFLLTSYDGYVPDENRMGGGYFALSSDFNCCILTSIDGDNNYCVGSVDADPEISEILNVFSLLIK